MKAFDKKLKGEFDDHVSTLAEAQSEVENAINEYNDAYGNLDNAISAYNTAVANAEEFRTKVMNKLAPLAKAEKDETKQEKLDQWVAAWADIELAELDISETDAVEATEPDMAASDFEDLPTELED